MSAVDLVGFADTIVDGVLVGCCVTRTVGKPDGLNMGKVDGTVEGI